MFKRKVLVTALLAIVLLASFMDGRIEVDRSRRHRPRTATASEIMAVDLTMNPASFKDLLNQIAGGIAALDPSNGHTSLSSPMNQVAGGIAAIDPNN